MMTKINTLLATFTFILLSLNSVGQNLRKKLLSTMAGEKYGYVDENDKVIIKPQFDEAYDFREGHAPVKKDEKFGLIDSTGKEIIPFKYKDVGYLQEGLIVASLNGTKYGYIDINDKVIIPFTYDLCYMFVNNFGIIKLNGKFGMINKLNKMIVPCKYVSMENMIGGIAKVCAKSDGVNDLGYVNYENFWGFINDKGVEISKMNCDYKSSINLGNGYAIVNRSYVNGGGSEFLIDDKGNIKISEEKSYDFLDNPEYNEVDSSYLRVKKGTTFEKYGLVDYEGKELLPVNFERVDDFEWVTDELYLAKVYPKQNDFFYINEEFKCVEFNNKKCPEY
jgi:hypothetical protein